MQPAPTKIAAMLNFGSAFSKNLIDFHTFVAQVGEKNPN